jgi:hypothetical protein
MLSSSCDQTYKYRTHNFGHTLLCYLSQTCLDVQQTRHRGQFVEQKLMLISTFSCEQTYKYQRHDFGHTLLCYLSQTWMFNKPTSEDNLLSKNHA